MYTLFISEGKLTTTNLSILIFFYHLPEKYTVIIKKGEYEVLCDVQINVVLIMTKRIKK